MSEVPPPPPGAVVPGQVLSAPGRAAPPFQLQTQPPAPAQAPAPAPAPAQAMPRPPLPTPFQPLSQTQPQALVPGATLAVRILDTATAQTAEAPSPGGGLVLTGTIAGSTANGRPILVTPQGSLTLAIPGPLRPGTKMTVELLDPRQLVFEHPAETAIKAASAWPALTETLTTLGGLEGAMVQSLLGTVMPQPNRKLTAALAFFLGAVRHGDARGWLGEEAAELLEKEGKGALLSRLTEEFRAMARDAAQTPPGEWRPLAFPLWTGSEFQRIELHVKALGDDDESGETGKGGGERSHRFILDLDLSLLGPLQLDGLVKSKSRLFDLILRSHQPLPGPLRAELAGAFSASLEAVGFNGGLAFQPGARGWIKPPPVVRRPGHGVLA